MEKNQRPLILYTQRHCPENICSGRSTFTASPSRFLNISSSERQNDGHCPATA
ncbi:hypothetical protein [Chitinophaga sp. 212800010-3]|uniref:hypothetical protein n=1 Tax=unclassified Chitinophaga TaxID=2619133 RepID=UPI002E12FE96